jgi:hypothetical protein
VIVGEWLAFTRGVQALLAVKCAAMRKEMITFLGIHQDAVDPEESTLLV